jgi:hypothetical protein
MGLLPNTCPIRTNKGRARSSKVVICPKQEVMARVRASGPRNSRIPKIPATPREIKMSTPKKIRMRRRTVSRREITIRNPP